VAKADDKRLLHAARKRLEMIQRVDFVPQAEIKKLLAARRSERKKQFEEHRKSFAQESNLQKAIAKPFLELIEAGKREESLKAFKDLARLNAKKKIPRHKTERVEPRITPKSSLLVPPYVNAWPNDDDPHQSEQMDGADGELEVYAAGNGTSHVADAGFYKLYWALPDASGSYGYYTPSINGRFQYHEQSIGYAAHTTGTLSALVVDLDGPPGWLGLPPQVASWIRTVWADGTGSFDTHDNSGNVNDAPTLIFPLTSGHRYLLYAEIGVSADDHDGGFWGQSVGTATLAISVPWMLVEQI
jgi:hypothetical protein